MAYEIYQREIVRVSTPAVTLNKRGKMVFNVAATKRFHEAGVENVFLLWDKEQRKFAIRPIAKKDPRTVKVRYSGNSKWASISCKGFLQLIGHDVTKTVPYAAIWNEDEGIFEVSMAAEEAAGTDDVTLPETRRKVIPRATGARHQVASR
jgi:hypothetical protein